MATPFELASVVPAPVLRHALTVDLAGVTAMPGAPMANGIAYGLVEVASGTIAGDGIDGTLQPASLPTVERPDGLTLVEGVVFFDAGGLTARMAVRGSLARDAFTGSATFLAPAGRLEWLGRSLFLVTGDLDRLELWLSEDDRSA